MNKKSLVQYTLLFFVIIITVSFFNVYILKKEDALINNEVKKEAKSDTIQDLQYISSDTEGNTYQINAKSGVSSEKDVDLIYLNDVNAKITFDNNKLITITAKKATYNNGNYDTDFYGDVTLDYDNHHLTSDNLQVKFSENYAKIFDNVIYKDFFSKLYADMIEIDLLKRTSKISMFKDEGKVKIKHNHDGLN